MMANICGDDDLNEEHVEHKFQNIPYLTYNMPLYIKGWWWCGDVRDFFSPSYILMVTTASANWRRIYSTNSHTPHSSLSLSGESFQYIIYYYCAMRLYVRCDAMPHRLITISDVADAVCVISASVCALWWVVVNIFIYIEVTLYIWWFCYAARIQFGQNERIARIPFCDFQFDAAWMCKCWMRNCVSDVCYVRVLVKFSTRQI